jgi:hypothetical protein
MFGDANQTLKIRLFLTDEEEFKWMKNSVAKSTCDGITLATALARYIHREGMRSDSGKSWKGPARKHAA